MSKSLVLAEKPSVGRDIARVLGCSKKGNGYLEGNKYIVTWALGHLVTLADPEKYNDKYKAWKIEDLPMLPSSMKLVTIGKTGKQFSIVREQMNRKDVGEIVIATDAGREGELVARWIIDRAHVKKPTKRLWISSVTDKAIKEGFNKLKDGREYENLYAAAEARAEADWIVGINATRALTCKFNAQLSCGRVQTPTLYMIAKREEEIKNFKPKQYYGIKALAQGISFTWQNSKTKDTKTFKKEECEGILKSLSKKQLQVVDVIKKDKKAFAPKLYDLTELQRDANKIYDFSAKETLSIMQRLYESHKLLTYPRTDSRYISQDIVDTLKDRVKACSVGPYSKFTSQILRKPIKGNKSFVDNSKVSDHHAIIPTEELPVLNRLSDSERKIYDLVVKRFLAVLFPPYEYTEVEVKGNIEKETFITKGKIVIDEGWKSIYGREDNEEVTLPELNKGDMLTVKNITATNGETKPPAPFNEGTLLSAMENPQKYMNSNDKKLIKVLGEAGGIGTVATRADIIEKLFKTFLIEKKGKDISITSKGKQLLDLVPEKLKSPQLTAEWEDKLTKISKGSLKKDSFVKEMKEYAIEIVGEIKNSEDKFKHDNVTGTKCPKCGKYLLEVNGKKGKMLVCQDRSCGHRETLSVITNARCPECHKRLELKGHGEGKIYVCSNCSFREKLSSFNKRFKKGEGKADKRETQRYMKKLNKQNDAPVNSALADALAKLNLK